MFHLGGIILEHVRGLVVEWCSSTTLMMAGLSGGLGDRRVLVDSCRVGTLSGAMVASTADMSSTMRITTLKM
jgi:hypothetical protein